MNSPATNIPKETNHLVLSIALLLAAVLFAARTANTQQLQKGISVVMATTTSAAPMPDADDEDAWVVAVTPDGSVFFGTDKVTPAGLADKMKSRPRRRDQKLYIKADERTAYAQVKKVLDAGREVSFETAVLLTSQPESAAPGTNAPPRGLEVRVREPQVGANPILVQLVKSKRPAPEVMIGQQQIRWGLMSDTLIPLLQHQREKMVQVRASGQLPFRDVVHVIDACRAAGANVFLSLAEL